MVNKKAVEINLRLIYIFKMWYNRYELEDYWH